MIWTNDQIEELKNLWARGDSGTVIGAVMGISRCSVLGKVHRLGLPHRNTVSGKPYMREAGFYSRPSRSKTAIAARSAAKLNIERPKRIEIKAKTFAFNKAAEQPTKTQLRAMLTQAVINTAAMT